MHADADQNSAAGFMAIRDTAEDLVLQNVGPNGDELLPLKRGTRVVVDLVGLREFASPAIQAAKI